MVGDSQQVSTTQGKLKRRSVRLNRTIRAGKAGRTTLHQGLSSKEGEGRLCGTHCRKSHTTKSAETKGFMSIFWYPKHVSSSRTISSANTEALYKYLGLCQNKPKNPLSLITKCFQGQRWSLWITVFHFNTRFLLVMCFQALRTPGLRRLHPCSVGSGDAFSGKLHLDKMWCQLFSLYTHIPTKETWPVPQSGRLYGPASKNKALQTFRGTQNQATTYIAG